MLHLSTADGFAWPHVHSCRHRVNGSVSGTFYVTRQCFTMRTEKCLASGKHSVFALCPPLYQNRCISFPIRHKTKPQCIVVIRVWGLVIALRIPVDGPFTLGQEHGWRCCLSYWLLKTLKPGDTGQLASVTAFLRPRPAVEPGSSDSILALSLTSFESLFAISIDERYFFFLTLPSIYCSVRWRDWATFGHPL